MRIGKRGEKNIYKSKPKIKFQKWNQIVKGKKICIISSGNIIINAYEAIKNLNKRKIFPSLIIAHTIKPLDKFMLKKIFKQYRFVVTLEEHSKIGGLSSSISEFYIENQYNNKFLTLSTGENFIVKSGKQENALSMLELSSAKIEKRIIKFLKK